MDEVVLKIKFSEEFTEAFKGTYIFLVFFTIALYMYILIYAINIYIAKQGQDKLVNYYNSERINYS